MENNIFENIREWGITKGIKDPKGQYMKLGEEVGEVSQAMSRGSAMELRTEIGDCVVVLTILANLYGLEIEDCICAAYEKISKRKGETKDGIFFKDPEYPEFLDEGSDEYGGYGR